MTNEVKMRQLELPGEQELRRRRRTLDDYGLRGKLRLARLGWAGLKMKAVLWAHRKGLVARGATEEQRRHLEGARIRRELIALGPTFIKIGQMLSTRVDLLPLEYTEELKELLDRVPPFPNERAFEIIERELGRPIREAFQSIDNHPIAAASLGQVYRARLKTGEEVVVKVQRPDLEERIALDIATLRQVAPRVETSGALKATDWDAIIDEFAAVIADEIDYVKEVANAERFRANFAKWPEVYVPTVHHDLSTRRVITMEYIPGIKVDDHDGMRRMGLMPITVAEFLVKTYLKQLLEDGFFHADPHPGNLRVMPDGRLAFFDFGMAGELSLDLQSQLVDAFFHIVDRDWTALLRDAVRLGFLRMDENDAAALEELGQILIKQYEGVRIRDLAFNDMRHEVADVLYKYPFQIPAHFTFILRALTTLEGVGSKADPGFNFFAVARPYAKEFMLKREGRYLGGKLISRVLRGESGSIDWSKAWKLTKMAWRHYTERK
jgi:predicted unusual protein kinase regulating ubiquinone biosynthesis (AarF/ABC1/UbiB family)